MYSSLESSHESLMTSPEKSYFVQSTRFNSSFPTTTRMGSIHCLESLQRCICCLGISGLITSYVEKIYKNFFLAKSLLFFSFRFELIKLVTMPHICGQVVHKRVNMYRL